MWNRTELFLLSDQKSFHKPMKAKKHLTNRGKEVNIYRVRGKIWLSFMTKSM
jgi:hypothetical protein